MHHIYYSITPPPPSSTLFPYTTLFRSDASVARELKHLAYDLMHAQVSLKPHRGGEAELATHRAAHLRADTDRETVFIRDRSEEHTSELQSPMYLVCRLLLEKKNKY